MKRLNLFVFLFCLLLAVACRARIITVDDDEPADFNNIQAAINDANNGDTVIVADGIYTGEGNRDIDFLGKAITLRSESGPQNCIIDCNGTEAEPHRGFFFRPGEDANSVLEGFTIRNGYDQVSGGGIVCSSASPTIRNCIITNNRAGDDGGGIMCHAASPTIRNCIITKNIAEVWEGGGIRCRACRGATIDNCLITENSARFGGGISSSGDNSPIYRDIIVTNCTFSANSAQYGGAVSVGDLSKPSMVNCILWSNTAPYGPEIAMLSLEWGSDLYISFSNVQGGEDNVYGYGLHWEAGNIDADPCFADAYNGDYHLKSQAGRWDPNSETWVIDVNTSICIDAGNPGCPLGDEPNGLNNVRINMGAYGGTAEASKSPANWRSIADLTNDWVVDSNDLKVFVGYWLETGQCIPSDLDRSQSVDFNDFALLAGNWGQIRNRAPVAHAGPDITAFVNGSGSSCCICLDIWPAGIVMMDGSDSYDPDGDTLTYIWEAPITWSLSGIGCYDDVVEAANPTGAFPVGSTTVSLTVSDGELSDTDSLVVTVLSP